MNVTVKDINILQSIQPQQVANYLQNHGWHQQNYLENKASTWIQENETGESVTILLPLNQGIPGFPVSMSVILETLEKQENRSQLEIIGELITTANNIKIQGIVRQIHAPNTDQLSGNIIIFGVVFDQLREIKMELFNHEYILAIKAYQERFPIFCTGDLVKEDSGFVLKNIHNFALDESWKN
ncbi:hypothetical protein MC7420_3786 [Coleofasciculus chthonoplastes PCC 7420]|uniref:Uncharacterized protein n=1 Tax=Coleofasciculus chthonoplastes PCC 7420 TaxID=118168 RepID=B4VWV7_9CYAN|nr:hypothetical protein [Coleofasciculus chthonoplastes]EDX73612.1 hypothetical protein MC7420_3786 [Coleofasciculus chthonoplastes PCC 7420]